MTSYSQQILRIRDFSTAYRWPGCTLLATICVVVFWVGSSRRISLGGLPANQPSAIENGIDNDLQRAATDALGQREGTIVVMDPQTGRVRAIVNRELAFANSFSPGSTIKPFVALSALRAGVIDQNSRTLCRERYSHKDYATVCAHPRNLSPLNPTEAIAYSCNYYFGTLGERLKEEQLSETLRSFGFGRPTGAAGNHEAAGTLLRGTRDPRNTLGEGNYLLATPMQLLTAYSALLNGGHLLTPNVAPASEFRPDRRAQLEIVPQDRALIIAGMRGAVRYGTAKNAGLDFPELKIIGKTGTSTQPNGFRTQGWFVGFAAEPEAEDPPPPDRIELGVLIFLKRAHGAEAAALARGVFVQYARSRAGATAGDRATESRGDGVKGRQGDGVNAPASDVLTSPDQPLSPSPLPPISQSPRHSFSQSPSLRPPTSGVKVHLLRENTTRQMSLEDYVAGVVAAEGSMEDQPEALKALAIAARTYSLRNLGRHTREGFDFCTLTHCQRFVSPNPNAAGAQGNTNRRALAAVRATAGVVLSDDRGQAADVYFSASCGGATANIQTLWGVTPPAYLRGVRDEYCATMPHHSWTDVIPESQLWQALRSDPRTDPGSRLDNVRVAQIDETGRAQSIAIEGETRRTVSGWDFKIIVGRSLGWNKLKSSRFAITRAGSDFVFSGTGFGHGLGLCQEGAHVLAQRGASYQQILAKYFPGANLSSQLSAALPSTYGDFQDDHRVFADVLWRGPRQLARTVPSSLPLLPYFSTARSSISNDNFRLDYPNNVRRGEAENILQILDVARANLLQRLTASGLTARQLPVLYVFVNDTTGDFVARTGQPSWAAAATKWNHVELQPIPVLKRRGVLSTTLRHELAHLIIEMTSRGHAPRWLAEGLALHLAGEGPMITRYAPRERFDAEEIDRRLSSATTRDEMRAAYAAAHREVGELIRREGEASIWRRVAGS